MIFLARFAIQSLSKAAMVAAVLSMLGLLFPPLAYLGAATIGLVTLRKGPRSGFMVLMATMLAIALLSTLIFHHPSPALSFALMFWLPMWGLAVVLRVSQSLAVAIQSIVALAVLGIVGFYLIQGDPVSYWRTMFETVLIPFMQESGFQELNDPAVRQYFMESARFMTGAMASIMSLGLLLSLLLARWWQSVLFNRDGFAQEFRALRLNRVLLVGCLGLFATSVVVSGTMASLASELLLPILIVFVFQGLAVVHGLVATLEGHRGWLIGLYMLLALAPSNVGLILGIFGLMDTLVDFRVKSTRFKK